MAGVQISREVLGLRTSVQDLSKAALDKNGRAALFGRDGADGEALNGEPQRPSASGRVRARSRSRSRSRSLAVRPRTATDEEEDAALDAPPPEPAQLAPHALQDYTFGARSRPVEDQDQDTPSVLILTRLDRARLFTQRALLSMLIERKGSRGGASDLLEQRIVVWVQEAGTDVPDWLVRRRLRTY